MASEKAKYYAVSDEYGQWWSGTDWTGDIRRAKLYAYNNKTHSNLPDELKGQMVQPVMLATCGDPVPALALGAEHAHPAVLSSGKRVTVLRYALKQNVRHAVEIDADSESEAIFLAREKLDKLVRVIVTRTGNRTETFDPSDGVWRRSDGKVSACVRKPVHMCPVCGCSEFLAMAHVAQDWKIGHDGDFIECVSECEESDHVPDGQDVWTCAKCGYDTAGDGFLSDKTWPL